MDEDLSTYFSSIYLHPHTHTYIRERRAEGRPAAITHIEIYFRNRRTRK